MTTDQIKSLQAAVSQMTDDALKAAIEMTAGLLDLENNVIIKATLACEAANRNS